MTDNRLLIIGKTNERKIRKKIIKKIVNSMRARNNFKFLEIASQALTAFEKLREEINYKKKNSTARKYIFLKIRAPVINGKLV